MATKKKRKKVVLSDSEKERLKHIKGIQTLMQNIGFHRLPKVDGKQFIYGGRTTEMDDMFFYENIIIIMEYTTGNPNKHLLNKKIVYDLILDNPYDFIDFLLSESIFESQKRVFESSILTKYSKRQLQLRIVYASKEVIDQEQRNLVNVRYLDYSIVKYFECIAKTIKKSTIHEFCDFLDIPFNKIGDNIQNTASSTDHFIGQILPEEHSSFEAGFKIITFYIDANSLLHRVYVLRNDSWRNVDSYEHYQRLIEGKKIRSMRKYLHDKKRVFINNIIVTLSIDDITLKDAKGNELKLDNKGNFSNSDQTNVQPATVSISNKSNIIGVIDGQHRIYAYHVGEDRYESSISSLRNIQNLLVTGIVYPQNLSIPDRLKFEAQLFLEINSTQQSANSRLTQAIENILHPDSTTAIAKYIISKLNESGPFLDMFEEHWYETDKIKTVSIISFALKQLTKLRGNDSLYALWDNPNKEELLTKPDNHQLLQSYKDYCVKELRNLFIGIKHNIDNQLWVMSKRNTPGILNVTTINGFINCLRFLIEDGKTGSVEYYKEKFKGIDQFAYKSYKSSQYRSMGRDMYKQFFQ